MAPRAASSGGKSPPVAAFRATGLTLDHVDVHNHMHLHPSVLSGIIANLAPGEAAVRLPREPLAQAGVAGVLLAPWIALMRARLRRAGLAHNDWLLGIRDSGRVDEARLLGYLEAPARERRDPPASGGDARRRGGGRHAGLFQRGRVRGAAKRGGGGAAARAGQTEPAVSATCSMPALEGDERRRHSTSSAHSAMIAPAISTSTH